MSRPQPWVVGQLDIASPAELAAARERKRAQHRAYYLAHRKPSKVLACPNNPDQYPRHKCAECTKFARTYARRGGSPNVYAEHEACARLWRAFIARALRDLAIPSERAEASAWLHNDSDPDLVEYRQQICDVADVSLDGLRRVVERADKAALELAADMLTRDPDAV